MGLLDLASSVLGGSAAEKLSQPAKEQAFSNAMLAIAANINPYGRNVIGDVARGWLAGRQGFESAAELEATQGMDYGQLADYWAQRGDAQKAQQYAELAQAQSGAARTSLAPQIGVNPETQQPEYFVMQEGGVPRFTGVVPQQKPTPVSQQRVAAPRLPTGMMWDAEAGRAVPVPGIPQKAAAPSAAPASPGKAPTGFRFTPEGNLQPIPGGPKDDSQQRKAANDMIGQTIATLDRLSKSPALPRAVGLASRVPSIPGGEAANFEATLETLKSQTFLPMIQSMRGMGALTDKEGQVLMQAVGELNTRQSPEAFRASLSRIKQSLEAKRTGEKSALERAREELARRKGGM